MRRIAGLSVMLLCLSVPLFAAPANGLGVSLPLVGRLAGAGGVVYKTAVDITNNSEAPVQVDFYIDGIDLKTGATIGIYGSLGAAGFTAQGSTKVNGRVNVRFEDIVDALAKAGLITNDTLANGFLGSALFVFDGVTRSGGGSAAARFYNTLGEGTVGVALKGHEITSDESQTLVTTMHDTRANTTGAPKMYTNMFINNTGLTRLGAATSEGVSVDLRAYSASTGQPVGNPMSVAIGPGKTASLGNVAAAMGATEQSVVVVAKVIAGNAAIQGVVSQVDDVTKDGSAFMMSRGD